MKTFLLRNKKPIVKWGLIPDNVFFKGKVPNGYNLAVVPSKGTIVLDVDRHGDINGFESIPDHILKKLETTYHYNTKNGGKHYWLKYTGKLELANKASGIGIDLRTHKGYAVYYPEDDIRSKLYLFNETSPTLNEWLEDLFYYV